MEVGCVLDEVETGDGVPRGARSSTGLRERNSGTARHRRFGANSFAELKVWDHSEAARGFCAPEGGTGISRAHVTDASDFIGGSQPIGLLVISHVINELQPPALAEIGALWGDRVP